MADPGTDDPVTDDPGTAPGRRQRSNPWVWISAVLAVVAAGLAIWAFATKSDRDQAVSELQGTQQELASTQEQLETAEQAARATPTPEPEPEPEDDPGAGRAVLTVGAVAAVNALIDDLEAELGATQEDLEATEQEVEEATEQAEKADERAAKAQKQAEQADDATDKAEAEADQAKAEADAARSRAGIARDCARGYITAIGQLFEADDPEALAPQVRDQVAGVTEQCRNAFAEA